MGALPPKPPRIYRCFCQSGWYLFLPLSAAAVQPKFGVNFALIFQIWPIIGHSSTSCLQQLMNFGKRSLIPPAVLAYERDGGFSLPNLGSRVT